MEEAFDVTVHPLVGQTHLCGHTQSEFQLQLLVFLSLHEWFVLSIFMNKCMICNWGQFVFFAVCTLLYLKNLSSCIVNFCLQSFIVSFSHQNASKTIRILVWKLNPCCLNYLQMKKSRSSMTVFACQMWIDQTEILWWISNNILMVPWGAHELPLV